MNAAQAKARRFKQEGDNQGGTAGTHALVPDPI